MKGYHGSTQAGDSMNDRIKEKFRNKAVIYDRIWLYFIKTAIDVIGEWKKHGIRILALKAFKLTGEDIQPSQEHSISFRAYGGNWHEAIEFLSNVKDTGYLYEIWYDGQKWLWNHRFLVDEPADKIRAFPHEVFQLFGTPALHFQQRMGPIQVFDDLDGKVASVPSQIQNIFPVKIRDLKQIFFPQIPWVIRGIVGDDPRRKINGLKHPVTAFRHVSEVHR
jgi:hypothetical protein